jgi:hypothetical protein
MMRRIHMRAEMHRCADARHIGVRAFIHRFDLFEFKRRVAGPRGK